MFLAQVCHALQEETVPDAKGQDSERIVMKLNPAVAPVKCAVLPLLKNKEELTKAARSVYGQLTKSVHVQYDEKDAIGRRYRRQDAIGTPYCVTVDFETLENETVTLRDRDTLIQERVKIADLNRLVSERTSMEKIL